MPDITSWEGLNSSPEFANLSYNDQLLVREDYLTKKLPADQNWLALSENDRRIVFQNMLYDVPQTGSNRQQEYSQLYRGIMSGNEDAQSTGLSWLSRETFRDQLSIADLLTKAIGFIDDLDGQEDIDLTLLGQEREVRNKELAGLRYALSQDQQTAKKAQRRNILANFGGIAADTLIWYGLTAPLGLAVQNATKAGKLARLTKAGTNISQLPDDLALLATRKASATKFAQLKLVPELLDSARGGVIEVVRQNLLENIQPYVSEDADLWERIAKNSAIFGEDFLYGMGAFFGLSVMAKAGKTLFGMGKGVGSIALMKKIPKEILGDDDFEQVITKLTAGLYSAEEIAKLPQQLQDVAMHSLRMKNIQANVENITDAAELMQLAGAQKGIWFAPATKKGADWFEVEDLVNEVPGGKVVLPREEALKYAGDRIKLQLIPEERGFIDAAMTGNTMEIHKITAAAPKAIDAGIADLAGMTASRGGKINAKNATYVVRNLAKKAVKNTKGDIDDTFIDAIKFKNKGRILTLADDVELELPGTVTTIKAEQEYLTKLVTGVKKTLKDKGVDTGVIDEFERLLKVDHLNGEMTPMWVKFQAEEAGYKVYEAPDGKVTLIDAKTNNAVENFPGYMSAGDFLYKGLREGNEAYFGEQLALTAKQNFGESVVFNTDGTVDVYVREVQKTADKVHYKDVDSLLEARPEFRPQTPVTAMPRWNITDNDLGEDVIELSHGVVTGSSKAVTAWTDTFKDYSKAVKMKDIKRTDTKILSKSDISTRYEVRDSEMNFTFRHNDLKEVDKFMKQAWDNLADMEYAAALKGARVMPMHGRYYVYQAGKTNSFVADNLDDLKAKVAELPEAPYIGRELSELDAVSNGLERELDLRGLAPNTAPITNYMETSMKLMEAGSYERVFGRSAKKLNKFKSLLYDYFAPVDMTLKRMGLQLKDPEYYQVAHNLRRANDKTTGMYYRFADVFEASVVAKLPKQQNKEMNSLMMGLAKGESYADGYRRMFKKEIPDGMVTRLDRTREMFDDLGKIFKVDGWKFLTDYYPRIRQMSLSEGTKLTGDAAEAITKHFGHKIPEVEFFAKNLRIGDVVAGSYMENFTDVVTHYVRQGYRSVMLDEPVKDVWNYIKRARKAGKNIEAEGPLAQYTERIMGFFDEKDISQLNAAMEETATDYFKNLHKHKVISKIIAPGDLKNLLGFLNSVTISATMAYRPWPVIRNLFQPFNTLGYIVSQDAVLRGMEKAIRDPAKRVKRLRNLGIITDHNHMLNYTSNTALRDFTRKGLHLYQSADNFNRAVTDAVAEDLISDGWRRFSKNQNMDELLNITKLNRIDEQDRLFVLKKLEEGDVSGAIDEYSDLLNFRSQFPYKSWENPKAFRGVLGKLFGAYQHYPVYYTANLLEGLRLGSWQDKVAAMGNTAITGAVAYGVFNNLLGINAKDFLFYTPVSMTGGPLWQMGNDLLTLTAGGYEGDIAWEQIKRNAPALFIPGAGMATDFLEGLRAFAVGDLRLAYTKALSAPVGGNF